MFLAKLEDLLHSKHKRWIDWCDLEGMASDPATQQPLTSIQRIQSGSLQLSAKDIIFRDPKQFAAGQLHENYEFWDFITQDYYRREEILKYISQGVSIYDFISPFKGSFKGKCYNSKLPPVSMFPNSKSCEAFEDFVSNSILERVANGSLSVWGEKGFCTPPHLVMPITVEPSKPRMCHDERFLNLWMKCPSVKFDPITDLPRYVEQYHYQTKLDDKSGYDHVKLTEDSRTFFGIAWKGYFFVYNTLPFGWSPSAYIYQTIGLAASHFIRSNGVPLSQYTDDRHIEQIRLNPAIQSTWSNVELAEAAVFIASLVLVSCGYFIRIQKSVLRPTQNILFLGLISDSVTQSFLLPPGKKEKFARLRESIIASQSVSTKTLQRFAGKVISFSLAVPAARLYVREVNAGISKGIKSSKQVPMSDSLKSQLQYWRFLDTWQDSLPWKTEKHISISVSSDASNTGWGGVISLPNGNETTRDYWSEEERVTPIAIREAKALVNTLITFSNYLYNGRVDAYIDSQNLLHLWNNQGGKNIRRN